MMVRKPEHRLRAVLALCGGKRVCEETGAPQPQYKMEATRIVAEFPAPKGDDLEDMGPAADPIERKQVQSPTPALRDSRSCAGGMGGMPASSLKYGWGC